MTLRSSSCGEQAAVIILTRPDQASGSLTFLSWEDGCLPVTAAGFDLVQVPRNQQSFCRACPVRTVVLLHASDCTCTVFPKSHTLQNTGPAACNYKFLASRLSELFLRY